MKKNIFLSALCLLLVASCVAKAPASKEVATTKPQNNSSIDKIAVSEDFVQGSEDIPLLVNMEKMFNEGLGFDSDAGSIMSSSYESKIDLEKVKIFYEKTLPKMGWKITKNDAAKLSFEREKEKLEIEFLSQKKKKVVKFFISSTL